TGATGDVITGAGVIAFADHKVFLVGAGSDYTTIQAAIDAASSGDTIQIASGTYNENLALNGKYLTLQGVDDTGINATTLTGQINASGTLDGTLTIKNMAIDATGHDYGVNVTANSTAYAGSIVLDNTTISGAQSNGFAYVRQGNGSTPTLTDTVGAITITNSEFFNNATLTSPAGGRGDILLFGYNKNLTISDVIIRDAGAFAQKAIQVRGLQDGGDVTGVGPYDAGGNIALTNLTVTGSYTQDLLAFYRIASFATFTTSGVVITASAPWGLFNFDSVGGTIDLSTGVTATNLAPGSDVAVLQGLSSTDTLIGTSGDDNFVGRVGADSLNGGAGNDTFAGFAGADSVDGGNDTDTIILTAAANDLAGATNAQIVNVEAVSAAGVATGITIDLHNQSEGFAITGGSGADTITGGAGADTINAGTGIDTVAYTTTQASHTIAWNGTTATITGGTDTGATGDVITNAGVIAFADHKVFLVGAGSDYTTIQAAI
ncbi:MAG: calcium-binding protein, partial [Solirubrobacteraceae bacterium]|nr:calcium-binding protein [Solirubrobacteraceae bacterium]